MGAYDPVIPKSQLVHGRYYFGSCRNASVARWNAEHGRFYHWRYKFGYWFIESISCPEDDSVYDVFIAEKETEPDREIPFPDELELDRI